MASKTAIAFEAVYYGSANMVNEHGGWGYVPVHKAGVDTRFYGAFREQSEALARSYMNEVKDTFNREHGHTGKTARSMSLQALGSFGGNPDSFGYRVRIGGNIGFVISSYQLKDSANGKIRIKNHGALYNAMDNFVGSRENPYPEFGPVYSVPWPGHQADFAWQEELQGPLLLQAQQSMRSIASKAMLYWRLGNDKEIVYKRPWTYGY